MLAKNFLNGGKNKSERWLLFAGAMGLALCAFLASGFLDSEESQEPVNQTSTEPEKPTATIAEIGATEDGAPATKKSTWRTKKRRAKMPQGPGVGSVWRTIGALVLVLVLVFLGAGLCSKMLKKVRMRPQGSKVLELVDVIPLGPKKQVFVISAYGRKLVVGATADSMNVLSEFAADEIEATEADSPLSFPENLSRSMKRQPSTMSTLEVEA